MDLGSEDLLAIWVTLKLGFITTVILLVICTPLAWWLSRSCAKKGIGFFKDIIAAIVSLPMVLPPTVLGFYLLVMMGPKGFLGQAMG
ncbi:MAG: molybdate ABC transporter permease subunit, partial [Gammaproteobacteria bacterium]